MDQSQRTTDHTKIRRWVEARNGKPVSVHGPDLAEDAPLRIDFPEDDDSEDGDEHEELTWEEFFEKFDEKRLAFVYQESTASGEPSNFNLFVRR
jgi:hypothetical protein